MSIIIRLQNLPWSANALDIRQYFQGLSIPEGGVHIVGGEQGDAFIAFSTDEDARQAFLRNNGKIKEVQVTLMLSSRTEMQRVIEQARNQSYAAFMQPTPLPAAVPPISSRPANEVPAPAPVPASVPPTTNESSSSSRRTSDKEERSGRRSGRRSRSRSRSRDKSRDRKSRRRDRDRSRSRDKDKKDRRRKDRSRSRKRSRSRDTSSRRSGDNRRSAGGQGVGVGGANNAGGGANGDGLNFQSAPRANRPSPWANHNAGIQNADLPLAAQSQSLLGNMPLALDPTKINLEGFQSLQQVNGLPSFQNTASRASQRDNWQGNNEPPRRNNNRDRLDRFQESNDGRSQRGRGRGYGNSPRDNFDDKNNDNPINSCVIVEPFYGNYADLRKFFSGLQISYKGIKLINDEQGYRSGIGYVQFVNQKTKQEAMARHGRELNGIAIKITHLSDEEYEEAVDRYNPRVDDYQDSQDLNKRQGRNRNITKFFNSPNANSEPEITDYRCLKIEDLPTYVKEQDILHIFSLHPLLSLHITPKSRGSHVAYVKFSSNEVAKKALEEKSHHVIGGKQVTVKPCKDEEFEKISIERESAIEARSTTENLTTDCLHLEHLPTRTNDRDIADFFSDIGVVPTKIHLISNNLGFTGIAYCEFETIEEASKAVKKDGAPLGSAQVSVRPMPRAEMERILNQTLPAPNGPPIVEDIGTPSAPLPLPLMPHGLLTPLQQQRPIRPQNFQGPHRGGGPQRGGGRFGGGRGGAPRQPRLMGGPPSQQIIGGAPEDAPPGCTVFMNNIPYKAGTNEILAFFDGYNCTNNVSRRYNANNQPSSEAKVTFYNPEDAAKAVQELNGEKIWERSIYLQQA